MRAPLPAGPQGRDASQWPTHRAKARRQKARRVRYGRMPEPKREVDDRRRGRRI